MYSLNGALGYNFDATGRNSVPHNTGGSTTGSTALYHHNGTRYGLGLPVRASAPAENKLNGLQGGTKQKRGDVDRECTLKLEHHNSVLIFHLQTVNRFAGTRLEDLQGEIPSLCRDQHGCRYLQKKLEEGVAEHRDMIFRETFSHFADLMTGMFPYNPLLFPFAFNHGWSIDPFGNYLCQKLLEYCSDEQRNLICESVAQDLVSISLNMHGTRAVQKMIDFLSTRRQVCYRVIGCVRILTGNSDPFDYSRPQFTCGRSD